MADEKVALVTGGSRGIGRAICVALGGIGYRVVVNYRGNTEAAAETRRLIEEAGGVAEPCQADISIPADRDRLVDHTLTTFGRIDLLVNNAGIGALERRDLLDTAEPAFRAVLDTNLIGPYFLTQRVANEMVAGVTAGTLDGPAIVTISSVSAYTASTSRGEYCVAKAGQAMMTTLFATRLAEHGIGVFEIRPGVIRTDMTAGVADQYDVKIAAGLTPIARWGTPEDVAAAVLAVAGGHFPFSTGEVLNVDGGWHLRRL
jgi:NAD(P)-dependent dehydrogenase (short-subunit alcohol dehydrogenase family)